MDPERLAELEEQGDYVALMPGERRTIRAELQDRDARGETPRIVVDGFNVQGAGQR